MATELGEDKRGELVDRSVASVVVPSSISGSWSCPSVISFAAPAFVGESRWIRGRCPHATSLPRGRNRRLDTALQLRLAGPEKEARGLSPDTESPFLGPGSIRPESCLKACLNRAMAGGMDAIFDYSSPLTQVGPKGQRTRFLTSTECPNSVRHMAPRMTPEPVVPLCKSRRFRMLMATRWVQYHKNVTPQKFWRDDASSRQSLERPPPQRRFLVGLENSEPQILSRKLSTRGFLSSENGSDGSILC
ncbi:hypothetical protein QR685DRAFT_544427 [Neurospora intermedia]|uniref:Uncharacterized protein n=1 Tax=Neurospora intermedia TaxID=5142 RepID=A0ABR3DDS6_NEUIN